MNLDIKADLIKEFIKYNPLSVFFKGTSMLPTIPDNSTIVIHKPDQLEVGRIYVYHDRDPDSFDKYVCHRLVRIEDGQYIFRGDNREKDDLPIDRNSIIGEVKYEKN
jgi:phage repressor protein C with HTH and peptisase S24 domain